MKPKDLLTPLKRLSADRHVRAIQATFDPHSPAVTRLHVIPSKPGLFQRHPNLILINGWHMFMLGPSWSDLLRAFIEVLNTKAELGKSINPSEQEIILDSVVEKMREKYPMMAPQEFVGDLDELLTLCIAVARGANVPESIRKDVKLRDLAKLMKAPLRMDLLVSPMVAGNEWICPLHCKGCYATLQPAMVIEKELSTDEWKAIIDKCRDAGIPQLTFTGGEPTQRDDLIELIEHAQWHVTRLNTSGVNLNLNYCKALFNASLDGIQVTLYSQDHNLHDHLVGKVGAWLATVQGIQNALQAGLSVSVNTPLVKQNSEYDQTLQFIAGLGVKFVSCSGLIPTGAAQSQIKTGESLENEELMQVMHKAVEIANNNKLDLNFTSPGWLTHEQLQELGLSDPVCGACLTNMAVMPNGAVTACQSWLDDPQSLGNMLTIPWEEIWNHPKCKKMRRSSQEGCPLGEAIQ